MQDKYLNYLQELKKTLTQIEILIEDNNQNVKDCLSIISELNKNINFKKHGFFKSLIFKFFNKKQTHM